MPPFLPWYLLWTNSNNGCRNTIPCFTLFHKSEGVFGKCIFIIELEFSVEPLLYLVLSIFSATSIQLTKTRVEKMICLWYENIIWKTRSAFERILTVKRKSDIIRYNFNTKTMNSDCIITNNAQIKYTKNTLFF